MLKVARYLLLIPTMARCWQWPTFQPLTLIKRMGRVLISPTIILSVSCYELGSVMKAICALAALEEGVVQYDEIIDCEGRFAYVDGVKIENPTIVLLRILEENHGKLPFYDVLRYSSNVGIAKVAKRMGALPIIPICNV